MVSVIEKEVFARTIYVLLSVRTIKDFFVKFKLDILL